MDVDIPTRFPPEDLEPVTEPPVVVVRRPHDLSAAEEGLVCTSRPTGCASCCHDLAHRRHNRAHVAKCAKVCQQLLTSAHDSQPQVAEQVQELIDLVNVDSPVGEEPADDVVEAMTPSTTKQTTTEATTEKTGEQLEHDKDPVEEPSDDDSIEEPIEMTTTVHAPDGAAADDDGDDDAEDDDKIDDDIIFGIDLDDDGDIDIGDEIGPWPKDYH